MKVKKILRFYFSAESLERAFDNIIINCACNSAYTDEGAAFAERICDLIGEKHTLSSLWQYLDGVICGLKDCERAALERYSGMRCGIKRLCDEKRKEIKRASVKFMRRARRLDRFGSALELVGKYYCLIAPTDAGEGYLSGR